MSRAEWLEWRRQGIGGTDVATIMGDGRWQSEWDLWLSKARGVDTVTPTEAMLTGSRLEGAILDWAVGATGATAREPGGRVQHDRLPILRGTPDGWLHLDGERVGVEAKCPGGWDVWEQVPTHYVWQCRAYMACSGTEQWVLAALFRCVPAWRIYWVERDHAEEARMLEAVEAWWDQRITRGEPPELDGSAAATAGLRGLHPPPAAASEHRIATPDEVALAREYHDHLEAVGALAAEQARIGNRLRAAIGDAPGIRWAGGRATWCRWTVRGQPRGRLIVRLDRSES